MATRERLHNASLRTYFYMIERLGEPSTLRGMVMAVTGAGIALQPSKLEVILAVGSIVVGLIGAITPDTWRRQKRLLDLESGTPTNRPGMGGMGFPDQGMGMNVPEMPDGMGMPAGFGSFIKSPDPEVCTLCGCPAKHEKPKAKQGKPTKGKARKRTTKISTREKTR